MNSIEWFIEMWGKNQRLLSPKQIIDKAKEMHRKEIIDAATWGTLHQTPEQYYNEQFKKD